MNLGVLTSGNLGVSTLKQIYENYIICFVFTDKKSKNIITFCEKNEIKCFVGNPRGGKGFNYIKSIEVNFIVSVNYLFLIESDIINHSKKISFNIHGSLLPRYRGRAPHIWSIINNEKETGITAHLIDKGCDTGKIIKQIVIPIEEFDSGNDILIKYKNLYFSMIKYVIDNINSDNITYEKQIEKLATYFGKRTPEDGLIDWNWQKERIKNWVRAQSYPYPGSFTYVKSKKVIIDEVEFSDFGYNYNDQNGKILSISPLLVKTPNGVLIIKNIRNEITNIKPNDIFK